MSASDLNSAIYVGSIRHRRHEPHDHHFTYPLFMMYLDLDELDEVMANRWYWSKNRFNVISFKRSDYYLGDHDADNGEAPDLKSAVIERVTNEAENKGVSIAPIKRVAMLSHLRYFNVVFNPVSFYYCFDQDGVIQAILAEITNTPWDERFQYVLFPDGTERSFNFEFNKAFHVSPFNPMDMHYKWRFSKPEARCNIHMENYQASSESGEVKHFDATLTLEKEPLKNLPRLLIRFPNMCVSVMTGIYWQAFKLWIKKTPFYDHPATR